MSVQIIKWIILLFVTGNCLSETCKANDTPKVCLPVQSNITIINQADNMLASLVSFLHFNAGDLTEEHTKKMPKILNYRRPFPDDTFLFERIGDLNNNFL